MLFPVFVNHCENRPSFVMFNKTERICCSQYLFAALHFIAGVANPPLYSESGDSDPPPFPPRFPQPSSFITSSLFLYLTCVLSLQRLLANSLWQITSHTNTRTRLFLDRSYIMINAFICFIWVLSFSLSHFLHNWCNKYWPNIWIGANGPWASRCPRGDSY